MQTSIVWNLTAENPPREGSVVFMENLAPWPFDRFLEWRAGSPLVHTAILLHFDGEPYVYEGYPPRFRKMPFADYLDLLKQLAEQRGVKRRGGLNAFWWQPREGLFTPMMLTAMRTEAQVLVGTKFRLVLNWWFDIGVHCSEGVGRIVEKSGLIYCDGGKETAGKILAKLLPLNDLTPRIPAL